MSHPGDHHHEQDPALEQEHEDDDAELNEEDVVEVVEDEGDEGMDEDDDDNDKYDGEIVIGAPMPGEEEEMEQMLEDNTLGATCRSNPSLAYLTRQHYIPTTRRYSLLLFTHLSPTHHWQFQEEKTT